MKGMCGWFGGERDPILAKEITDAMVDAMTDEKADPPMWGRPVDVLQMPDGAMLVSDDYNGIIYRVSYKK